MDGFWWDDDDFDDMSLLPGDRFWWDTEDLDVSPQCPVDDDFDMTMPYPEDDEDGAPQDLTEGSVVERLRPSDEEGKKCQDLENVADGFADRWTRVPEEVMILILARLPYSSFCSFRSVCKRWNSLMVYPDPSVMKMSRSGQVPLGVADFGDNRFACYNASSHSWNQLPACFGSSFGVSGFQGEQSRVVAGAGGLLVLEFGNLGLSVVNPVNKFERRLPPLLQVEAGVHTAPLRNVHLRLNQDDSYQIFVVVNVASCANDRHRHRKHKSPCLDLQIYCSRSNSWGRTNMYMDFARWRSLSTVEFAGRVCCLSITDRSCEFFFFLIPSGDQLSDSQDQNNPSNPNEPGKNLEPDPKYDICDDLVDFLPDGLRNGQLFVKDGKLMLAGVISYEDDWDEPPQFHIWKLTKGYGAWDEVSCMSGDRIGKLSFKHEPYVSVCGDYMCVINSIEIFKDVNEEDEDEDEDEVEDDEAQGAEAGLRDVINKLQSEQSEPCGQEADYDGVMCQLSSNRWWKLPRSWDNPDLRSGPRQVKDEGQSWQSISPSSPSKFTPAFSQRWRSCGSSFVKFTPAFSPFLFEPRMDLVP